MEIWLAIHADPKAAVLRQSCITPVIGDARAREVSCSDASAIDSGSVCGSSGAAAPEYSKRITPFAVSLVCATSVATIR